MNDPLSYSQVASKLIRFCCVSLEFRFAEGSEGHRRSNRRENAELGAAARGRRSVAIAFSAGSGMWRRSYHRYAQSRNGSAFLCVFVAAFVATMLAVKLLENARSFDSFPSHWRRSCYWCAQVGVSWCFLYICFRCAAQRAGKLREIL